MKLSGCFSKPLVYYFFVVFPSIILGFNQHPINDSHSFWPVFAYDLNSDGNMDILSANRWYKNDGTNKFSKHFFTDSTYNSWSVFAIDLNDDDHNDILTAERNTNEISWYRNDGFENFTKITITDSAIFANSVFAIDLDGDTDIDVLSASMNDSTVAWYENDGNENFTVHTIYDSSYGVSSVHAIDVDGDTDIDVLSSSQYDNRVIWYENDGNENFTVHEIYTNEANALWVQGIDIDYDGDVDVVSCSMNAGAIYWHDNDGNENFTRKTITSDAFGVEGFYAVDIDEDGDGDVVAACSWSNKIILCENDGSENFSTTTLISGGGGISVYPADIDSDGDIDIVSKLGSNIHWSENLKYSKISIDSVIDQSINEDSSIVIDTSMLIIKNSSGGELSILVADSSNYSVSGITISPALNYHGTLYVPIRIVDNTDTTNTVIMQITVLPVADSTKVYKDSIHINEGDTTSLLANGNSSVLDNDINVDGMDNISSVLISATINGSISLNSDGTFKYSHNGSENFVDSFSYVATDGNIESNVVNVNISIVPVNDNIPIANNDTIAVQQGKSVAILKNGGLSVIDNDLDEDLNDVLTASITSNVFWGSLTLNSDGTFGYTHDGSSNYNDQFSYMITDEGGNESNEANVIIHIDPSTDIEFKDLNNKTKSISIHALPNIVNVGESIKFIIKGEHTAFKIKITIFDALANKVFNKIYKVTASKEIENRAFGEWNGLAENGKSISGQELLVFFEVYSNDGSLIGTEKRFLGIKKL